MRIAQEKVELFMRRHGLLVNESPTLVDYQSAQHRHGLIREENEEYLTACAVEDLTKVADAIADLLYVVLGAAVQHGIDIQPIFDEVHKSNLTKDVLDPITRKGGKGANYKEPHIADLLLIQATGLDGYGHGV